MTETACRTITCQELNEVCSNSETDLIDVRTPAEFREVHSTHARNVPLDSLDPHQVMAGRASDRPLYVICLSGGRAAKACDAFQAAGYTNVVNVDGGTRAWDSAGLPVVRGKKTMGLERQVRIAAGFLVLTGAVLGYFVHAAWIGLPAFVGAGLIFAGITDTCAMGMLIARMPWNQVGIDADSSSDTCAMKS